MKSVLVVKQMTPGRLVVARQPQPISLRSAGVPGQRGLAGGDGQPVELQATGTHLQWRLNGSAEWIDLMPLSAIEGDPGQNGRPVELQASATHLQWRLVGDAEWIDLIALAAFKGDRGEPGMGVPAGGAAGQVLGKAGEGDYQTAWMDMAAGGGKPNGTWRLRTSRAFVPGQATAAAYSTTAAMTANRLIVWPFRVEEEMVVARIGMQFASGSTGGTVYFGIYSDRDTGDSSPAQLLASCSIPTAVMGNNSAALDSQLTLQPGVTYWIAVNSSIAVTPYSLLSYTQEAPWGFHMSGIASYGRSLTAASMEPDVSEWSWYIYTAGSRPAVLLYPA